MLFDKCRLTDNSSVSDNHMVAICDICHRAIMVIYEFREFQFYEELLTCGWRIEAGKVYCRNCAAGKPV